ncbi:hypothetical protein SLS53_002413 [Cytospora paraplurivora]|uniref:Rhodopsin domain-containing protein n=1 Tax=Cytospora paraplurivora TaxID=2898453 RepID=A0AAN9UDV8_9PEZI
MGIYVNHLGYHLKDIPLDELDLVLAAKYDYATQLLYNPILALVKNGMLVFFYRVGASIDNVRWYIIALIIFNTTLMVAIFLTDMLQCIPVSKVFHPEIHGRCIDTTSFFVATAAVTILTDILTLIIPTWITWNLAIEMKKKIAIIFLLSMGLLVTGISIYRMYYLIVAFYDAPSGDTTYSVSGTASSIEVNLAIAAACGPFLKPVIVRIWPNFFDRITAARKSHRYDAGPNNNAQAIYRGPAQTAYSATASAAAKQKKRVSSALRGSTMIDNQGQGFELQSAGGKSRKSVRWGNKRQSSTLVDVEDDDSSQRGIVAMINSLNMNQEIQPDGNFGGSVQSLKQAEEGIVRETSVRISYTLKKTGEEAQ